jgi:hypothetical protein
MCMYVYIRAVNRIMVVFSLQYSLSIDPL